MVADYLNKIEKLIVGEDKPFVLRKDIFALIIGLGGSGVGYITKIKEMFIKRYGDESVKRQMSFLCIDTPPLKEDLEKKGISKDEYIQLTHGVDDDSMKDWVNPTVMEKLQRLPPDAPGAGGVRMIGRIKLFSSRKIVIKKFKEIFSKYFGRSGFENVTNFYVIEIASVCGGTGCGTFIDIPYFIRKAIDEASLPEDRITFFGFLELPDSKINREGARLNEQDIRQCKRNGYAALKELQYFMSDDAVWSEKIRDDFEPFVVEKKRVFTSCFLLSSNAVQIDGTMAHYDKNVVISDEKRTLYFDHAIPEMINIMLSRREDKPQANESPFTGFDEVLNNVLSQEKNDPNMSRRAIFSTAGVSRIEVPLNEIIICLFNRIFIGLNDRWDLIKDSELLENIIKDDIEPIFNISSIFKKIEDSLDLDVLVDAEIFDPEFEKSIKNKLNSKLRDKVNRGFSAELDEKVDKIYKEYGPFVASKILEQGVYVDKIDKYIDNSINSYIKENYLEGNENEPPVIRKGDLFGNNGAIENYKTISPGWFKKNEKKQARENLIKKIKFYFLPDINEFIKTKVKVNRYNIIDDDVHSSLFKKITELLKAFSVVLFKTTDVDTIVSDEQNDFGRVVSWDFSNVDYKAVSAKLNYLFSKKITYFDDVLNREVSVITQDEIFIVENEAVTKKIIFSKVRETGNNISVRTKYIDPESKRKIDKTIKGVISISDIVAIRGHEREGINFEEMLTGFLLAIKENSNRDVFDIMLEHFNNFINVFLGLQFEDKIYMFSENFDPSRNPDDLKPEEKEQLLREAFRNYTNFSLPSFPVVNNKIDDQFDQRNFVVSISPKLDKKTRDIMKESRGKMVIREEVPIVREKLNQMITVAFYFEYALNSYRHLEDCRTHYEREKNMDGLHLAENIVDWRKLPEIQEA